MRLRQICRSVLAGGVRAGHSGHVGSGGDELRRRNTALLIGGASVAVASVLRLLISGGDRVALALLLVATLAVVLVPFFRADRRRKRVAEAAGAWGSSSSVHVDQLRSVPRFRPLLASVQKVGFTKGWIGGGVVLDGDGVTWTPTNYSQTRRHVPILAVPWSEVTAVHLARQPGLGSPAVLELQLRDGSSWAMNVRPYGELRDALPRFPVAVR